MEDARMIGPGVIVWGTITVVLATAALIFVTAAGCYLNGDGHFSANAPALMPGMYVAPKDNGSLVAGALGFSGLAWAYFFSAHNKSGG
jgi:hypothetical protein